MWEDGRGTRCIERKKMQWEFILEFTSVPSHLKKEISSCAVAAPRAVPLWGRLWQSEHCLGVCAGLAVPSRASHWHRTSIETLSNMDGSDGFPAWRSLREECSRLSVLSPSHTYFLYGSVFHNLQLNREVKLLLQLVQNKWLFIIIIAALELSGQHFWEVMFG